MGKVRAAWLLMGVVLSISASAHPGALDAYDCHREGQGAPHCHGAAPRPGDDRVYYGPVVSISDGDTLRVKVQGVVMVFRLADIDAPEKDQPYGTEARAELARLLPISRVVVVVPVDTDRYGRTVAQVWAGKIHVNRTLVARGAAWFYPEYARDATLYQIEQDAREARRGLWAGEQRIEPWVWRRPK